MLTMHEIMDLRMQQQFAQELYRQQIMQRIPDPFASMLPLAYPPQPQFIAQHPTLGASVQAKLENNELWQQFHKIGTEMIITKSGRRMFPSMRVSVNGLDEEANYCVLLEMVPLGDCRYKFSGSQWIPAGGAEPQSPQRMYLHPDSPATGAHWQSQALLFNKVKLTNNTLDSSGHIVLASMHKYQPRIHVIRTTDLTQLPWAPQKAFVFPETEFIAVTAYQNDRITKLKIDNNPFAKGFRESGQARCKRKLSATTSSGYSNASDDETLTLPHQQQQEYLQQLQPHQQHRDLTYGSALNSDDDDRISCDSSDSPQAKRVCTMPQPVQQFNTASYNMPAATAGATATAAAAAAAALNTIFAANTNFTDFYRETAMPYGHLPPNANGLLRVAPQIAFGKQQQLYGYTTLLEHANSQRSNDDNASQISSSELDDEQTQNTDVFVDVVSTNFDTSTQHYELINAKTPATPAMPTPTAAPTASTTTPPPKKSSFSISAILGNRNALTV